MERNFVLVDGRINIVKVPILPKGIYKFSAVPMKLQRHVSQTILKFVRNYKIQQIVKAILLKNSNTGSITNSDLKQLQVCRNEKSVLA